MVNKSKCELCDAKTNKLTNNTGKLICKDCLLKKPRFKNLYNKLEVLFEENGNHALNLKEISDVICDKNEKLENYFDSLFRVGLIERTNVNYYMPNRIFGDSEGSINEFKDYIYLKELEHKRKLDESQSKYYEAKWEYEKLKTDLNLYKPEGYVYFIGSKENNVVKIGYSLNPKKRLQQLQTSIPYKLKLYGVIPGIIDKEIELQKLFAKYNINNEWFEFNDEIMVVINAINIMNNLNISKEKLELLKEQQEIAIEWKRKMDSLKAKTKRKKEKEAKKAWEIVKDGKTLYSNPELILGQKEFLEPAALISYNFGEIPQKDKMYVKRQLYGYRVKKVYKDKKYVSEKEGIVSKHGKKIGRAAFIIEAKNTDEIMKLFDERKVKYSLNKIWL